MDDNEMLRYVLILPALTIVGGVLVIIWGIRHATRRAELQHQERIAMIERGMAPPEDVRRAEGLQRSYGAKMSLGILLCGLGLGLVLLITFAAGEAGTGTGVGGAIVMVGIAFIVSAIITQRQGPSLEERIHARTDARQADRPLPAVVPPPRDPEA